MRRKYYELACQQMDLLNQLNQIDSLLPEDYKQNFQAYPQLFKDDDSLFRPDCIFQSGDQQNTRSRDNKNILIKGEDTFQKQKDDVFEEYLDTLQINQFIKIQSNKQKNSEISNIHKFHSKQRNSLECTFKPSISKKSNQIAVNMCPSFQRLTTSNSNSNLNKKPYRPQQQVKKQYSKQRIEKLSKPRVLKTEPNQNIAQKKQKYSKHLNQKVSRVQPKDPNYLDVAARNAIWQQQKKQKLEKLRKEQQENRIKKEASSFTPKLTNYRGQKQANISDFGKEGIANYFQRLNQATKNRTSHKNTNVARKQNSSPYSSRPHLSKTPTKQNSSGYQNIKNSFTNCTSKQNNKKSTNTRIRYQQAVEELHRKLMNLQI